MKYKKLKKMKTQKMFCFGAIFIRMKAWGDACMACQNSQCFNSLAKLLAWCRLGNTWGVLLKSFDS